MEDSKNFFDRFDFSPGTIRELSELPVRFDFQSSDVFLQEDQGLVEYPNGVFLDIGFYGVNPRLARIRVYRFSDWESVVYDDSALDVDELEVVLRRAIEMARRFSELQHGRPATLSE